MRKLTILYDASCGLCLEVKLWISGRSAYVELEFVASNSVVANKRFPTLAADRPSELIAVDDRGGVYRDDRAWLMVMWALREYRALAERLSSPALRPLARRAWRFISDGRRSISGLLALRSEAELTRTIGAVDAPMGCAPSAGAIV